MTRIKTALLFIALFLSFLVSQAQPGERIKQLKIAYLTEKIPLSTEDAQAFWPVYNAYNKELDKLKAEGKHLLIDAKLSIDSMTDEEISDLSDNFIKYRKRELAISEKYHPQFKKVLAPRKLLRYYRAEQQFGPWIIRQFRNNRNGAGKKNRGENNN